MYYRQKFSVRYYRTATTTFLDIHYFKLKKNHGNLSKDHMQWWYLRKGL